MAGCASCLHKNVHPNVCSDCVGGTHFKPRNKTNADRIRAMSDDELAELISSDFCEIICSPNTNCQYEDCRGKILNWLRQEANDVGQ